MKLMRINLLLILILAGCSKPAEIAATTPYRYLYVSTGLCYAGIGFTAPNINSVGKTLSRVNLTNQTIEVIRDYANFSEENSSTSFASGIVDNNDGYLYAAIENATATGSRRVERIKKEFNGSRTTWYQNSTTFSSVMRDLAKASDGGLLVSRTTAVERLDSIPARKMATVTLAWGQTHAGTCATNNTIITSIIALPSYQGTNFSKYVYSHATAGQNDIAIIGSSGSVAAGDCLANQPSTTAVLTNAVSANLGWNNVLSANATPTAMAYIETPAPATTTGKLIVAYSTNALNTAAASGLNNALVMYDITETSSTAVTIGNGQVLFHDYQYLYGVTALAYDKENNTLYASMSNSLVTAPTAYNIEKFTIDITTPSATRIVNSNGSSFQTSNSFNNCVTSMFVGN